MVRTLEGKHAKYFEAVLQLRDLGTKEQAQQIVSLVEGEFMKANIPITDFDEVRGGLDYKVADKRFTRALGRKLRTKFGGELKETATLHTKIKGKDAYRVTVLYRCAGFTKKDIVKYLGRRFEVISMAKEIVLRGIDEPEKLRLKYDQMKKIAKLPEDEIAILIESGKLTR